MVIEGSDIVFSSGRSAYAYSGIIGIVKSDKTGEILTYGGYDQDFPGGIIQTASGEYVDHDEPTLTPDERRELALYCIDLRMRYGGIKAEELIALIEGR